MYAFIGQSYHVHEQDQTQLHMKQFTEYLCQIYQDRKFPTYYKEPDITHTAEQFISLALMNRRTGAYSRRESEDQMLRKFYGDIDHITRTKAKHTLKMANVGKYVVNEGGSRNQEKVTKLADNILVEGAPGVGKTTFAWKLCQGWAKGELLQDWSIVILIQLRDERVREAKNLYELVYHPDERVRERVCQQLSNGYGKGVFVIIDGYDELSDKQQSSSSVFQQLVSRLLLHQATLMILSRPIATRTLPRSYYSHINQRIEILGFTKENVDRYITSTCSNEPELAAQFKSYLSSQSFLYSLMYIPLHCAIVTDLFLIKLKQLGSEYYAPKSLTEIYTDLVSSQLLRYLSGHPVHNQKIWLIDKFTDLPEEVYRDFLELAEVAANGIKEKVYVFHSVPKETLGLMHQVEEVYPGRGRSVSYSFLHLTLQEYLAAYHWSQQSDLRSIVEILFSFSGFLKRHNDLYDDSSSDLWPVLLFIAGMTQLKWCTRDDFHPNCHSVVKSSLLHLLYETQCPEIIKTALSLQTADCDECSTCSSEHLQIAPCKAFDFFVSGYCIPASNRQWIVKVNNSIEQDQFLVLSQGLHMATADDSTSFGRLDVLEFNHSKCLTTLPQLHPHTKMVRVIKFCQPLLKDCDEVFTQFPANYPMLETLYIRIGSSPCWQPLFEVLPHMKSIVSLCIDSIDDSDILPLFTNILQNCMVRSLQMATTDKDSPLLLNLPSSVECLNLHGFSLTPVLTQCIGKERNALHTLELYSCNIPTDACTDLVRSIQSPHCVLHTLKVDFSTKSNEVTSSVSLPFIDNLVVSFAANQSLKKIQMECIPFSLSVLELLASSIVQNTTLEELTVRFSDIDDVSVGLAMSQDHPLSTQDLQTLRSQANALISAVNERTTIRLLTMNRLFREQQLSCNIRENLSLKLSRPQLEY